MDLGVFPFGSTYYLIIEVITIIIEVITIGKPTDPGQEPYSNYVCWLTATECDVVTMNMEPHLKIFMCFMLGKWKACHNMKSPDKVFEFLLYALKYVGNPDFGRFLMWSVVMRGWILMSFHISMIWRLLSIDFKQVMKDLIERAGSLVCQMFWSIVFYK